MATYGLKYRKIKIICLENLELIQVFKWLNTGTYIYMLMTKRATSYACEFDHTIDKIFEKYQILVTVCRLFKM